MFRVALLLVLASVLLTALAMISCLSVEDKREIRGASRGVWVLAILLLPLAGALAWFLAGRPRPAGATGTGRLGSGALREPPRPRAPDDDPEFLRSLDQPTSPTSDDERLLRQWEEDLKRREDEQRRRDLGSEG